MAKSIHMGDLLFDESTGEIFRMEGDGTQAVGRLAPQPAEFLSLMVANHPEITSHETIREKIWPGVGGDFEKSMHFCMRKIRAALGDNASKPRYIQTIPRRGYRFVNGVQIEVRHAAGSKLRTQDKMDRLVTETGTTPEPREAGGDSRHGAQIRSESRKQDGSRWRSITLVLAVLTALLVAMKGGFSPPTELPTLRIAVMTFEPEEALSDLSLRNEIAETLVERLANSERQSLQVIGPTTTAAYAGSPPRLDDLIDDYDIDFLINGRFFPDRPRTLLAEIIRTDDRAHVWVHQMDLTVDGTATAEALVSGFFDAVSPDGP